MIEKRTMIKSTNRSFTAIFVAAALSLGLAGCASEAERMAKEGYPPGYTHGYDDGCHSGKMAGGNAFEHMKKDVHRYGSDNDYKQGWDDGFGACEKQQEATDRAVQRSIEQQHHSDDMAKEALKGVDTSGLKNM